MTLTNQELQIMKIVWQRGEVTVRHVYEAIKKERQIAYTTVMTMMNILERKGRLKKRQGGRAFIYAPVNSRDHVLGQMVHEFVDRTFDGSLPSLLQLIKRMRNSRL